jgi:hypothetical protein
MIRLHSIVPFDLGGSFDTGLARQALRDAGYLEGSSQAYTPGHWLDFHDPKQTCRFQIHPDGFGCMLVQPHECAEDLTDHKVGEFLVTRRRFHRGMIEGQHPLCGEIKELRLLMAGSRVRFRKRASIFWETCPYVLSVFSLKGGRQSNEAERRRVASLVEPSIVFGEDKSEDGHESTAHAIASRVPKVSPACCEQLLIDHDVSEESAVFISWAGVVVCADEPETLDVICEEVFALETRLQVGWTMLHYVNRWKHVALDSAKPLRGAFDLRWQMARMIETTEDLIDASVPTRLKKIYAELVATSGFEDEKRKAERGLAAATEYASMVSERAEHKYRIVVEILLFLFGFCQVIPLVFDVPFVTLPTWVLWPVLIAAVLLVAIRYSKLRR